MHEVGSGGRRRAPLVAPPVEPSDPVLAALEHVFPGVDVGAHRNGLVPIELAAGDTLCREGEPADAAWIVVRGRLRAIRSLHSDEDGLADVAVADMGPGCLIGEAGLVDGGTRSATVFARRDAAVVELSREWLAEVIGDDPTTIGRVVRSLDSGGRKLETGERVIALVPAGAPRAACEAVIERLREIPDTIVVDARVSSRGEGWLRDLDAGSETVVLVGDDHWTPWTERVAMMSDRIVTLADATAPGLHPSEAAIADLPDAIAAQRTVVFVHPAETPEPRRTRERLALRPGARHLHLRTGHARDIARVARHLTGSAVCFVVSGGGARALASISVYRELRRRGIPIDAVSGSSAGAVISAMIAKDTDPDEMLRRARGGFLGIRDPTLPVASILRGRRLWEKLGEHLGDGDIEDLWIPFVCITTDLTEQRSVEHVRGPLRLAVRASVSLPGVFPPVDIGGHLHVDGGILDNLPVNAVRRQAPDATVIAVDVTPPRGPRADDLPPMVSGANLLVRRALRGEVPRMPTITAIMTQSALLGASRARREVLDSIDCHLHLDLERFGLLDFGKLDEIVDAGSHLASPMIEAWADEHASDLHMDPAWTPSVRVDEQLDPALATTTARAITGSLWTAIADLRYRLRRFVVAMVAASVVLALLLLMTGVVNELDREPSITADTIGASTWLLPTGIESPFTSNATFDESVIGAVGSGGTVRPVLIARLPVTVDGETIDAILVGHAPDGPGMPAAAAGRAAQAAGEVAIASFAGASVGDTIGLGASTVTVTGTLDGATLFAGMPLVFTPIGAARDLVAGGRPVASAVLVAGEVDAVPDGLHARGRNEIVTEAKGPVERPILTLHLVQALLAIVAAMIIGAVVYLASLERTRDVAVLRAVGTTGSMLALGVAAQALVVALVAAVLAVVLEVMLAPVFPLTVHLTTADLVLLPVVAALVAMASSYLAIRRTLRIDPSDAFAGAGG